MSFDIFFQPCRFGTEAVEVQDESTGQTRKILPNEPLTAAELAAVRNVLSNANASAPDNYGCYQVRFTNGGSAEIYGSNLEKGCMVALWGLTAETLKFLFDLLKAGNWTMIPPTRETRAIASSVNAFKRIPEGFPPTAVCESPAELGIILNDGFDIWEKYRDQIVGTDRR